MHSILYRLTSDNFTLPIAVSKSGTPVTYPAAQTPIMFWPDGSVCWEANLFLQHGLRRGLSRRNRGGTLREHSKQLSPLVRYCYDNKLNFYDISDSAFSLFIRSLMGERHNRRPELKKRDNNRVLGIGRTCLAFFEFLESFYPELGLVKPGGQIRVERRVARIRTGTRYIQRTYLHHHSFPTPNAGRDRLPVSSETIDKLIQANQSLSPTSFIRRRRYIMLRLFEITGARRIEVANIKTEDILRALTVGSLEMFTAKTRTRHPTRTIPISSGDLALLSDFLEKYRKRTIKNTLGLEKDHGYFFISQKTGKALTIDTLGEELTKLVKAAGLKEETCLHCFRHRFITKLFVRLIEEHHYATEDDLRRAVLCTETIKRKVMEWSGHKSIKSLDRYIHLAFEEVTRFKESVDLVSAKQEIESALVALAQFRSDLAEVGPTIIIEKAERLLQNIIEKIASAKVTTAQSRSPLVPTLADDSTVLHPI